MKNFLLTCVLILFSCNNSTYDCGEIDSKYEQNGEYFLVLILSDATGDEAGRIYGDARVDKETYLSKNIGEEHCIEE